MECRKGIDPNQEREPWNAAKGLILTKRVNMENREKQPNCP